MYVTFILLYSFFYLLIITNWDRRTMKINQILELCSMTAIYLVERSLTVVWQLKKNNNNNFLTRFFFFFFIYSARFLHSWNDAVVIRRNNNRMPRDETRAIDTKGKKTSAKCSRPRRKEVTSNPLFREWSRDGRERSEIARHAIRRFNGILNVLDVRYKIDRRITRY